MLVYKKSTDGTVLVNGAFISKELINFLDKLNFFKEILTLDVSFRIIKQQNQNNKTNQFLQSMIKSIVLLALPIIMISN